MNAAKTKIKVAICGARGYAGVELARLVRKHPHAILSAAYASTAGQVEVGLETLTCAPVEELPAKLKDLDLVFLATPAEASMRLAPRVLEAGVKVVDLSGAFRLEEGDFARWYGLKHETPRLLADAEYGLVPFAAAASEARLIANPGCFATAALLAVKPIMKLIDPRTLALDGKSGTTGAGRKAEERLLHAEVEGQVTPYRIARHQHLPEIARHLDGVVPLFATHLMPIRRGLVISAYARTSASAARIAEAFAAAYAHDPLVHVADLAHGEAPLSLRRVVGTPRAQIAFKVEGDQLYVFALIDNLLKGAASQAVENMNRMFRLPTSTGLTEMEGGT